MLPHTQEYADTLRSGNVNVDVTARSTRNFETVTAGLDVIKATVTVDGTAAVVRSLSADIADPDGALAPRRATDALAPFGNELVIESGLLLPNGTFEYKVCGVFGIEWSEKGLGVVSVSGKDRSAKIASARHEQPYVIPSSTFLADAWGDLIQAKYPGIPMELDPDAFREKTAATIAWGEGDTDGDPWANARTLATTYGRESVIDPFGTAVLRKVVDPTLAGVTWDYVAGPENLAVDPSSNRLDPTGLYNVWVVEAAGTATDPPVRATVEITDPGDPLYPGGPFGRRPKFYSSPLLTSVEQCQSAGEGFRLAQQGLTANLTFSAVPNACHEPNDLVRVESKELGERKLVALVKWSFSPMLTTPAQYTTMEVTT